MLSSALQEKQVSLRGKLLVVDDDATLLQLLKLTFDEAGYTVATVTSGADALRALFSFAPDLVILDIMMPGISGWEVCQRIRGVSSVPIIMLTARNDQEARLRGLELGADDYVCKPFDVQELVLRTAAVLRRTMNVFPHCSEPATSRRYDDGHLFIDLDSRVVQYAGRRVTLTPHEFDLLACFVTNAGKVLKPEYLLRCVWGFSSGVGKGDYVKTYIYYLRQKLEPDPANPCYILTERGLGYRLALQAERRTPQEFTGDTVRGHADTDEPPLTAG